MLENTVTLLEHPGRKLAAALALAALVALSGCGRKGPLEPHPSDTQARKKTAGPGDGPAGNRVNLGGNRRTLSSPITPPKEPFVLDPLL